MKISFSEISNWEEFEDLATSFFEKLSRDKNDAIDVFVEPSGKGSDGGRDILVTIKVNDSFMTFTRKWVVQCKFYDKDVTKSHLSDINIPSLISEYGADGYLLICRTGVTGPLSRQFEDLRKNCRNGNSYLIWRGSQFLDKLQEHDEIIERYFPKFHRIRSSNGKIEKNFDDLTKEFTLKLKQRLTE